MRQHLIASAIAAAVASFVPAAHADQDTTVGGKMYVDFSNISQDKNGTTTDNDGYGLDVKRFYLAIDHKFDDIWSVNLTTDFNYVSNDSETQLFVKKAYVQAKLSDFFVFRAGSADMPWIPFVENWYGYRYVENTLIDRLKFGNSADWGLFAQSGTKGPFNYAVSVVNGGGYKNPSRSSGVDVEGRIDFQPVDGLVFAVGGYSGDRGKDVQSSPSKNTATRWDALAAYKNSSFALGVEYFRSNDWNLVTSPLSDTSDGWSIFGNVNLSKDWAVFARYDKAKLSKDLDPSNKDTYYNAGIEWSVRKGIKISGVWKHETAKNTPVDSNGELVFTKLKTDEIGVFTEIKF